MHQWPSQIRLAMTPSPILIFQLSLYLICLVKAELVAIDEAAAIPLPTVKKLMGPYLVFMSSTGDTTHNTTQFPSSWSFLHSSSLYTALLPLEFVM